MREAEMEPKQHLGYTDGERVRDERTGRLGHVLVRDDEEVGRYAEVQWTDSFVSDELELAVDKGLSGPGDYGRDEQVERGYLALVKSRYDDLERE